MCGAVVLMECARTEIGGLDGLADYVRFADPRSLRVRKDDGDDVPCFLEGFYEGVDVGGGLIRGRAIIVDDLDIKSACNLQSLGLSE